MALRQFPSLILSGSPRPVTQAATPRFFISSGAPRPVANLPAAARSFSSGSLRPVVTRRDAWRCFSAMNSDVNLFHFAEKLFVVCGTSESQRFPPLHHECWVEEVRDGYRVQLYMVGVGKDKVKVEILDPVMMIVQATKPTDLDGEDDSKTRYRYGILGPPDASFTHSAFKAEINNGVLNLFVPKC